MPRPTNNNKKVRFNLELTQATADALEDLRERSQAESKTEVIRRALALYDAVIDTAKAGGEVIVRSRSGRERSLLIL